MVPKSPNHCATCFACEMVPDVWTCGFNAFHTWSLFCCVLYPLPLPLSSCLGCIPPLIGLPFLRFMRLPLVCFYCLCDFVCVFSLYIYIYCLSRQCPLLATFLSVLLCLLSLLISDFRFDLVWFRLSCDHGSLVVFKQVNSLTGKFWLQKIQHDL